MVAFRLMLLMSIAIFSGNAVHGQSPTQKDCAYSWWRDATPCCNGSKIQTSYLMNGNLIPSCKPTMMTRTVACNTSSLPCQVKIPRPPPRPPTPPRKPMRPLSPSPPRPMPVVSLKSPPSPPLPLSPSPPRPMPVVSLKSPPSPPIPLSPSPPRPMPVLSSPPLDDNDYRLFVLVNEYRKTKGLPPLLYNADLAKVAHIKAHLHGGGTTDRCNMHSFTGPFACCYPSDHSNAPCMWNKVRQYTGNPKAITGFEIAASTDNIELAVKLWSKSPGHNAVMITSGGWSDLKWLACGAGRFGSYCWFG
jgi:uncharacterized protein YkwD